MITHPAGELGNVSPAEMREHLRRIADWAADYRDTLGQRSIMPSARPGDILHALPRTMPDKGVPIPVIMRELDSLVMPGVMHWGHPSFLGYYGSTSNGPALIGEIAAAALNVSAMSWKSSPAATELESTVLDWIRDLLGFPAGLFGVVYDTASVALLHALAAARERASPGTRDAGLDQSRHRRLRVYASEQAHSSIVKVMVMLGLGSSNLVRIPVNDVFEMDVDALGSAMQADLRAGHVPMAVIATLGTTSTASVDRIDLLATVARQSGAWLHVDAAYGGAIGALPERRHLLRGLELADSIVVNAHKWLFVPLDFSALYVRKPQDLRSLFSEIPEYLEGDASAHPADEHFVDYMDYGVQLGRRFRALKAWWTFRAFGADGMRTRIREHCRLAELFASWVEASPAFELATPVTMGIVCFRRTQLTGELDDLDTLNVGTVERINASGTAYLTWTRLRGQVFMRIGIGNIATTEAHLRALWCALDHAAASPT